MKIKLTIKFLFPIIILLLFLTVSLSIFISFVLRTSMLNRAATFVADFVQLQALNHIPDSSVFKTPDAKSQIVFSKVQSEVKTHEVVRIKVWNKNKTVIYSDDSNIVGKTFGDNDELNEALEGNIKTELVTPSKGENIDERNYNQLMEIYVPIYLSHAPAPDGVIEIYYTLHTLNAEIMQVQTRVVGFIIFTFLLLAIAIWLLLHFVVIHRLRMLEKATKEIEKGNLDIKVATRSHDELGQLAISFNSMADGLKRLQELRNEFVYIGAHELKTPVTGIKGYLSFILERTDLQLPEDIKHNLTVINELNEHLNKLVGNILEIARSAAGKIEIKLAPVDIAQAIKEIVTELKPLADNKKITITNSTPSRVITILADKEKLKEIFMNLISNAIKYGNENGYINITYELTDTNITTHITNSGVGIPKDEQQYIFSKFFRAENVKASDFQGTGLGLFITKELVDKMNGKIWFTSEENNETSFSISFPFVKE